MNELLRTLIKEAILAELKLDKAFLAMLKGESETTKKTYAARGRKIAEDWIKRTEEAAEQHGLGHIIAFNEYERDHIISLGSARYSHYNRQRHNHEYVISKLHALFEMRFLTPKLQKARAQIIASDETSSQNT